MATRPIKISIIGDDSQLKKTLKGASRKLEGFGKSIAKVGLTSGVAFAGWLPDRWSAYSPYTDFSACPPGPGCAILPIHNP